MSKYEKLAESLGYGIAKNATDNYGKLWAYCRYGLKGGSILYAHNRKELIDSIKFAAKNRASYE